MTFTVTLVNGYGIWQSSDLRLTDPKTHACVDDYSVKHVGFKCPDGAAVLAYAGLGKVGSTHISDWVRKTVAWESYTVNQTLTTIRDRATADLGPVLVREQVLHMFSVGAFIGNTPWVAQLRNFSVTREHGVGPPKREFLQVAHKASEGFVVPWPLVLSKSDMTLLRKVCTKRPRAPKEFSSLLAEVNARTAASSRSRGTVSPHCVTSYMPPEGGTIQTECHGFPRACPTIVSPFLLYGVDTTDMMRKLLRDF